MRSHYIKQNKKKIKNKTKCLRICIEEGRELKSQFGYIAVAVILCCVAWW